MGNSKRSRAFVELPLMLSLQYFNKLRESLVSAQPTEKQPMMARCFENLMDGVDRSLLIKNRDRWES